MKRICILSNDNSAISLRIANRNRLSKNTQIYKQIDDRLAVDLDRPKWILQIRFR